VLALGGALLQTGPAMAALDLAALWDFREPALSEQRFRAAMAGASSDDQLILQTQIARTHGLRGDFDTARRILDGLQAALATASPEARVRHALETGRTWASGRHTPAQRTPEARARARAAWEQALALAREARLDALAIDAIHMFAFIDTAPADQQRWAAAALAVSLASDQPDARRWEGSIRHNLGYALHQQGRLDAALAEFQRALALRQQAGKPADIRVAHWMVAWTLRGLGRLDEALAIQRRLADENAAAGTPDPHVFEELELIHRAKGDVAAADAAAAARQQAVAR